MDDQSTTAGGGILAALRRGAANPVDRRLLGGTVANLLDKFALLCVQLAAIPLLSHHWGAEGYGTWLMLMTIPTYVAVSDFGLGTAAGVEITRHAARGETAQASEVFQSTWCFVLGILGVVLMMAGLYCGLVIVGTIEGNSEFAVAVLLVTVYAVAAVQTNMFAVVFRATHKFALAMLISAGVIVAEGTLLVVVVLAGGHLVAAMSGLLLVRLAGCVLTYVLLRRLEPWVRIGISDARTGTVRRLAGPSLAAFSLALASSISLQGMVLAIGWAAGPAVAGVFGAARFLARIPLQFSGLVVRASIPELTRAQVGADAALVGRLSRLNNASALAATLPFVPLLALLGPLLLATMSGGSLTAEWWLFALLATTTTLGALWQAAASPLVAANQQARFAYAYAAISLAAIGAVLVPGLPPLAAAGAGALAAELMATILVFRLNRRTHPPMPSSENHATTMPERAEEGR